MEEIIVPGLKEVRNNCTWTENTIPHTSCTGQEVSRQGQHHDRVPVFGWDGPKSENTKRNKI